MLVTVDLSLWDQAGTMSHVTPWQETAREVLYFSILPLKYPPSHTVGQVNHVNFTRVMWLQQRGMIRGVIKGDTTTCLRLCCGFPSQQIAPRVR